MFKDKYRIGYVAPGWPLEKFPNGIVSYIKNICSGMPRDVDTRIYVRNVIGDRVEDTSIIDLSEYSDKSITTQIYVKILANLPFGVATKWKYDHCLTDYANSIRNAWAYMSSDILEVEESFGIAKYLLTKIKVPIITRLHGPWFIHGPILNKTKADDYQMRVMMEGEAIALSLGVTSPSQDVLNQVREFYNNPLTHAQVIPNPVKTVAEPERWRPELSQRPKILVVSRFDLHKGGDIALDAFRLIAMIKKEVELIFVGPDRGVVINGKKYSFYEYLNEFIPEAAIKERIIFLGHQSSREIAALRKQCTVTIVTSRYDNFPMSALEAVATGSPLIGVNVGGVKEIIHDDFNGLLAEAGSAESLAEKALYLLDDLELMQQLSKNAVEDCEKRFSPEVVAKQTLDYYETFL